MLGENCPLLHINTNNSYFNTNNVLNFAKMSRGYCAFKEEKYLLFEFKGYIQDRIIIVYPQSVCII